MSRILVVANETLAGTLLHEEIARRAEGGRAVFVVAPALTSRMRSFYGDLDAALVQANERLDGTLAALRAGGIEATGRVSRERPVVAATDAIAELGDVGEVIISTHPPARSHWIERGVVEEARRELRVPVEHVVVDVTADHAAHRAAFTTDGR